MNCKKETSLRGTRGSGHPEECSRRQREGKER